MRKKCTGNDNISNIVLGMKFVNSTAINKVESQETIDSYAKASFSDEKVRPTKNLKNQKNISMEKKRKANSASVWLGKK